MNADEAGFSDETGSPVATPPSNGTGLSDEAGFSEETVCPIQL